MPLRAEARELLRMRAESSRSQVLYYFAYGSNMHPAQIAERCCDGPATLVPARLPGYEMSFFGRSPVWAGALETAVPSPGRELWGIVYRLSPGDAERLEAWQDVRADGTGGYFGFPVEVLGADGRTYLAELYKKDRQGEPRQPSRPYIEFIVAGAEARGLPADYIAGLRALPCIEPDFAVPMRRPFDVASFMVAGCSACGGGEG